MLPFSFLRRILVEPVAKSGIGMTGYQGYNIYNHWNQLNWPDRFQHIGSVAGPLGVGVFAGPGYFQQGLIAGRPTYNLGGIGEVPGAINVQPPYAPTPPEPYVIIPSNQLPFPAGSGNIVVNNSPISPQGGGGPWGPSYIPEQIASIAGGGGQITISQGVAQTGTLTSGQQAVISAVPVNSSISTAYAFEQTTVNIMTPLSGASSLASYTFPSSGAGAYDMIP